LLKIGKLAYLKIGNPHLSKKYFRYSMHLNKLQFKSTVFSVAEMGQPILYPFSGAILIASQGHVTLSACMCAFEQ